MPSLSSVFWLAVAAVVVGFAALDVGLGAQAYLGLGAAASIVILYVLRPEGWLRVAVVLFALFVSLRYLLWRYTETLPPLETLGFAVGLALILAETHGFVMQALGMLTNAKPREPEPAPLPERSDELPTVDVFIPTYDEPADLVRQTVIAATQLRYPADKLKVHLLDDGGTDAKRRAHPAAGERARALEEVCAAAGATYRTRRDNRDAKAGNINTALADTSGDLVLVLDCDHIPTADFLEHTVGHFRERPGLAFVQTPHFFRNPDPIERNLDTFDWMPSEGEMFYGHTLKGMDHWNAAFFCGSAALLARPALEAVGGISTRSITEDADTALDLHARGFESLYLERPMVAGVAPDTFAAFVQQRTRWCQGMLQILRLNNPLTKPGLQLPQRLSYLNSVLFWLFSLTRFTFLLVPLAFIFFDLDIIDATLPEFVAFIAPHIFVALTLNNFLYGKLRLPFVSDVYETAQSLFMAPAAIAAVTKPRAAAWKVTPKNEVVAHDKMSQLAPPLALLFGAIGAGEAVAVWRLVHEPFNVEHLAIVLAWNSLNLVIVAAAFGATLERGSFAGRLWMPVGTPTQARCGDAAVAARLDRSDGRHAELVVDATERERFGRGERLGLAVDHGVPGVGGVLAGTVLDVRRDRDGAARYRIAFEPTTLDDERAQIATLYGSSERWAAFLAGRRRRRPLLGGVAILAGIGLRQLAAMADLVLRAPSRESAPAAVPRRAAGVVGAVVVLALLGALLFARGASAQDAAATPAQRAGDDARTSTTQTRVVTLRALSADGGPGTLDRERPRAAFDFVVRPNTRLDAIDLRLGWISSPELRADPEGLEVRLNGAVVDRLPVVPSGAQQDARVPLPADATRMGHNRLAVVARYADDIACRRPDVASWTTFNAAQSFLELTTTAVDDRVTLADLDRANWRWGVADDGLTLLTTRAPDDALLTTGANLAGALSLRRGQTGLEVRHRVVRPGPGASEAASTLRLRPDQLAPGLNVLFGTADTLADVLPAAVRERIDRPVIGVHRLAARPESLVVVLAGPTRADVHRAATTLADGELVLPEATWAELPRPGARAPAQRPRLAGDTAYRFAGDGGLRFDAAAQRLDLTMPAGLVARDNRKMTLRLDYAYAADLPRGAVLEVLVNDAVVRQLRLDRPAGAMVRDRRVRLELARFRPGENTIGFRAGVAGEPRGACGEGAGRWVEVFADSELEVPPLVDVDRYPDLAQLAGHGPLTRDGGGALGVTVARAEPAVVGAAWTVAARLAAARERPLPQLEVREGVRTTRRHGLWIGPAGALEPEVAAASGLARVVLGGPEGSVPAATPATVDSRRTAWREELARTERPGPLDAFAGTLSDAVGLETAARLVEPVAPTPDTLRAWRDRAVAFFRLDEAEESARLPRDTRFDGALAGLPRRGAAGEVGAELFLVAADAARLEVAVADLVRPERWRQLQGTAAAWRVDAATMATARPVEPVAVPSDTSLGALSLWYANWLAAHPGRWFLVVVAGALGLGAVVAAAVNRGGRS